MSPTGQGVAPLIVRPVAALRTGIMMSISLVAASVLGWQMTPPVVKAQFTELQFATLVLFVLIMLAMLLMIGFSRVEARADGLAFRNGVRRHFYPWSDIKAFRYRDGDPWAYVLLRSELEQLPLMAVQRVDGTRAEEAVAALRDRLVEAYRED